MLELPILMIILYTASLLGISEQVALTCGSRDLGFAGFSDIRVVDGFQRASRNDPIFLGSNQTLTVIDEPDGADIITDDVGVCYSTSGAGCYKAGTFKEECDNFLRGVTTLGEDCSSGSCRILACGTNARLPRCSFCNYDGSMLNCQFVQNFPEQDPPYNGGNYNSCISANIDGTEVFQFEKNHNATFLYDNGKLFYGLLRSTNSPISIIGLATIDSTTGDISGKVLTRVDSQKMVATGAHFVGTPFVHGDYAYFLFREPAQEFASLSNGQPTVNTYYSRIARICKNDVGTDVSSTQVLTSYLKQRLVCCIKENDECSVEFNEIQDFVVGDDNTTIHAIFTNEQNASPASALCMFDLTMIDETFNTGNFFGSDGGVSNDRWRENDGSSISPRPRPGFDCSNPNTGDTNFQRDYNQMVDPAVQTNPDPIYLEGDRFSNLEMDTENDPEMYIISSERGCLYQFEVDTDKTDLSPCQHPVAGAPIKDLELMPNNAYLVTTDDGVYDISSCRIESEVQEDAGTSPATGNFTARPNSVFEFVIDTTTTGSPNLSFNGPSVTDSNDEAYMYLVLKNESLDATNTLFLWRILILNDCMVTFPNAPDLQYTIKTYSEYTTDELALRCDEWEAANKAYTYLNKDDTCGSANGGTFDSSILLNNSLVQNCADCAYSGCTENTCTP